MRRNINQKLILMLLLIFILIGNINVSAAPYEYDGQCGDHATASIDFENGVLTISGTGEMYDYSDIEDTPWRRYKTTLYKKIVVEEGITRIGTNAFADMDSVTGISLPSTLKEIGANAFWDMNALTGITLPDGLEEIGSGCFYGCNQLKSIDLPRSVKKLGDPDSNNSYAMFEYCRNLKTINIPADSQLSYIESGAFYESGIESIFIPSTVEEIGVAAFNTYLLKDISVAEDNPYYKSVDGVLFSKDMSTLVAYPLGKESAEYHIPDSVTKIESRAFWGVGAFLITSWNEYGEAEQVADGTMELYIPDSVEEMGEECIGTELPISVYFEGSEEEWAEFVENDAVDIIDDENIRFNVKMGSASDIAVKVAVASVVIVVLAGGVFFGVKMHKKRTKK